MNHAALAAGLATLATRPGSQLPAPLISLRYRIERHRCWWAPWRKTEVRVEVFRLEAPYDYHGPDFVLHLPAGHEFEASIPRLAFPLVSPIDIGVVSVAVHDLLYRCGGHPPAGIITPAGRTFTRAETDTLFLHIMGEEAVEHWKREDVYEAVRECGASSWRAAA